MAEKFCKIFEKDDQQVLVKKDYNEEPTLEITTWIDGVTATFKFGYKTTEQANEVFNEMDDEKIATLLEFINN